MIILIILFVFLIFMQLDKMLENLHRQDLKRIQ